MYYIILYYIMYYIYKPAKLIKGLGLRLGEMIFCL